MECVFLTEDIKDECSHDENVFTKMPQCYDGFYNAPAVKRSTQTTAPDADDLPYKLVSGAHLDCSLLYSIAEQQFYRFLEDGQSIKHKKRRLACRVRDCPAEVTLDNQRLYKPMSFIHHNHDDHIELVAKTNNGQTSQRKSTTGHSQLIRLHTTKGYNQTSQRNGMMKSRSASKATPKDVSSPVRTNNRKGKLLVRRVLYRTTNRMKQRDTDNLPFRTIKRKGKLLVRRFLSGTASQMKQRREKIHKIIRAGNLHTNRVQSGTCTYGQPFKTLTEWPGYFANINRSATDDADTDPLLDHESLNPESNVDAIACNLADNIDAQSSDESHAESDSDYLADLTADSSNDLSADEEPIQNRKTAVPDDQLPYKYVPSSRMNSHQLLYSIAEKQLYRYKKLNIQKYGPKRFVCRLNNCRASLYMVGKRLVKLPTFKEHNHADQEETMLANQFKIAVREKCVAGIADLRKAYAETLIENPIGGSKIPIQQLQRHCKRLTRMAKRRPGREKRIDLPYRVVPGARLVLHSITENQLYRPAKGNPNGMKRRFLCVESNCMAVVFMINQRLTKMPSFVGHNHAEQNDVAVISESESLISSKSRKLPYKLVLGRSHDHDNIGEVMGTSTKEAECIGEHDVDEKDLDTTNSVYQSNIESLVIARVADVADTVIETLRLETTKKSKGGDAGENLPYRFVPGARTNCTMLYSISEKQLYRSLPKYNNKQRFMCRVPWCKAALYMVDGRLTRLSKFKEHNHENQEEMALRNEFEIAVRRKCKTELLHANEAFAETLKEYPLGGEKSSLDKMKRQCLRIRRNAIHEVQLIAAETKSIPTTCDFEKMLSHNQQVSDICEVPKTNDEYDPNVSIVADAPRSINRENNADRFGAITSNDCSEIIEHAISGNPAQKPLAFDINDHTKMIPINTNCVEIVEEFLLDTTNPCQEDRASDNGDDVPAVAGDTDELLPYQFVSGARKNCTLLYSIAEKQSYRLKKSPVMSGNRQRYVCNVTHCSATLYMVDERLTKLATFKGHNHANQEENVLKNQFEMAVRRLCVEQSVTTRQAFAEVLKENPIGGALSSLQKLQRNCSRHKKRSTQGEIENRLS